MVKIVVALLITQETDETMHTITFIFADKKIYPLKDNGRKITGSTGWSNRYYGEHFSSYFSFPTRSFDAVFLNGNESTKNIFYKNSGLFLRSLYLYL